MSGKTRKPDYKEPYDALRFDTIVTGSKGSLVQTLKVRSVLICADAYIHAARDFGGKEPRPTDAMRWACERLDVDIDEGILRRSWFNAKGVLKKGFEDEF